MSRTLYDSQVNIVTVRGEGVRNRRALPRVGVTQSVTGETFMSFGRTQHNTRTVRAGTAGTVEDEDTVLSDGSPPTTLTSTPCL